MARQMQKKAGALNTLTRLFGPAGVARWRQLAAARSPRLLDELNGLIRHSSLPRPNPALEFTDADVAPYTLKGLGMARRMAANGSRDFVDRGAFDGLSFRLTPRHLDALDPTGWLKGEYARGAGTSGARYPAYDAPARGWQARLGRNTSDWYHRDRAVVPTDYEMPAWARYPKQDRPMATNADGYVAQRVEQAYSRAQAALHDKRSLRELPEHAARQLYDAWIHGDPREFSRLTTAVLRDDMVRGGFASPRLAGAGRIVSGNVPNDRYNPRYTRELLRDLTTPGSLWDRFLRRSLASSDQRLRGRGLSSFGAQTSVRERHRITQPRTLADRDTQSGALPIPFAKTTVSPLYMARRRPPTRADPVGPGRMFYDPATLAHELGHLKSGIVGGMLGPDLLARILGRAFPEVQRRALIGRKPLAAALLNGHVAQEYAANRAAFGGPSRWGGTIHSAYNTYLLRALREVLARNRQLSPEEYRTFLRNYLPYGV